VVSRVWDKSLQTERSNLYVPAFPIAEWIVNNWWTLLNEPARTDQIADAALINSPHFSWMKRHCLRAAESGLMLPSLYLYNDGRDLVADWRADDENSLPNMPGEFVDSGQDRLDLRETEQMLSAFVSEVIDRAKGVEDERVDEISKNWNAIENSTVEETQFCTVAARMGLDPYDKDQVTDNVAGWIETILGDVAAPLLRDFTEAASAEFVVAQWRWVQNAIESMKLEAGALRLPIVKYSPGSSPWNYGYQLAEGLRSHAGSAPQAPIVSIETAAKEIAGMPIRQEEWNHSPGNGIRALVGRVPAGGFLVTGPQPPRSDSQRFLFARGLYHALFGCSETARLVTDAYTWDQQVSRAFAAELLAPRALLREQTSGWADRQKIDSLAENFQVSDILIRRQLQNVGVALLEE
jgi:hypothetical protein